MENVPAFDSLRAAAVLFPSGIETAMESESKSQTVRNLTFAVSLAVACVSLAWLISSPSFEPMIAFIASTGTLLGSADVLKSHTRNAYADV